MPENFLTKMELKITDESLDTDSGYGTPLVREGDHLSRINDEIQTNEEEIQTDEDLRRENDALILENKETKGKLNWITRKYENVKKEYSKLNSETEKYRKLERSRIQYAIEGTLSKVQEDVKKKEDELTPILNVISVKNEALSNSVDILNERIYQTEIRLSKTRKYLKHRERENGEQIDNLKWEIKDWRKDYKSLEKDFFNLETRYNRDTEYLDQTARRLSNDCYNLSSILNNRRQDSERPKRLVEKCKFLEFNASLVAGSLVAERKQSTKLKSKINELEYFKTLNEDKLKIKAGELNSLDEEYKGTLRELEALKKKKT